MENKKRRRQLRFMFLLFWFLITGLLLTTSTYAWFSSNRIVYIEFFNVQVETDGGMQISADATNWKTSVEVNELMSVHEGAYPTSVNQIPFKMNPVSTAGSIDPRTGYLRMYHGALENDGADSYVLTAYRDVETRGSGVESNGNFIAFDVFFKITGEKPLYLSGDSYVRYTGDNGVGIENSSRVAFVVMGNTDATNTVGSMQSMQGSTDDTVYIWEPNFDVHTQSGVENASNIYGITTSLTNGARINYDGVNADITKNMNIFPQDANADKYPALFKRVNVDIATRADFNNNELLFNLQNGVTKVRIYMWLEGQDVDSENNASFGNIDYYLQFTLNP